MSDNQTDGISAGELESLETKKLHELQVLAKSVGVRRVTGVRKKELIEKIREQANQASLPIPGTTRPSEKKEKKEETPTDNQALSSSYGDHSHIVSYKNNKDEEEEKKEAAE